MFNHVSVLLNETIEGLNIRDDGVYVDCTLGGGGHSSEILKRLKTGHLYCFDQDQTAIEAASQRLSQISNRFTIIYANFVNLKKELQALPQKKKSTRIFIRLVTSRASECEFDKLGRINIPLVLRQEGHLEKECVIVGVGDHVEIWNHTAWDEFYDDNKDSFDDISEVLDDIEI